VTYRIPEAKARMGRNRQHTTQPGMEALIGQRNGIEVSTRGRVPADVIEKYRAAGN
jgi:hypothetical protein